MPPRKRLGQLLTEMKIVDEHQLQSALGHQKQWGGKLGGILVQKGFCREDQVVAALSEHLSMPAVRLADAKIDPRAVKMVSRSVAERLHVFAYEVSGSGRTELITIAMSDPTDLSAVDQLAFHTGKRIKPMLAGDTEVLAAIQQHYAPEKGADGTHPTAAAGMRPFIDAAKAPGAAARLTPIAPMPTAVVPAGFTPNPMPPAQGSVAEPEPPRAQGPADAETRAEPLDLEGGDLPADGRMEGLEPIAAYSQGEGNVDSTEGIAPPDADGAAGDEPVPLEDQSALQGWGEGSPEGVALETPDSAAARSPAVTGWGAEETAHAPVATAAAAPWGEPTIPSGGGPAADELPIDAIMGTADVLEDVEATPPALDAPDAWSDISDPLAARGEPAADDAADTAAPAADEAGEQLPQEESGAGGPDPAWEAAAAAIEAAAKESEHADAGEAGSAAVFDETTDSEDHELSAETGAIDGSDPASASATGGSFLESPDDTPTPADELSIDAAGWSDDPAGQGGATELEESAFSMSSPAEEPPSAADAETAFDVDTQDSGGTGEDGYADDQEISATQRHGWLLHHVDREQFQEPHEHAEHRAEETDAADQEDPQEQRDPAAQDSFDEQQGYEQQDGYELQEGTDPSPGQDESAATAEQSSYDDLAVDEQSQQGEASESIGLATDDGWTGSSENDAQSGAWFGDALSSTTPLSPADLGTLTALGLDPADGAAAQRMLACLVRVLNRRQTIDLEELAAEIRESQLAADAAAQTERDDQVGASDAETPTPDDPANAQD